MRFPDPYTLRREVDKESVVFAVSQRSGAGDTQEDCFQSFSDECFALADGVGAMPNGETAAKLAVETAVWAYKHIRQHRYYWLDKKLFLKRIFRTTNMSVWQKRREEGFGMGLATTLMVAIVGPKNLWLGVSGDSTAWLFHEGNVRKLTGEKKDLEGVPSGALGMKRLGLVPDTVVIPFAEGDVLCMATDGVADYLLPSDVQTALAAAGETEEEISRATRALLEASERNGSHDDKSVCMIRKTG